MASVTITGGLTFAEGTSVSVYPRTAWPSFQPPSGAPSGSATAGPVTITNNAATFTGLADNTQYVAYAASPNRYKSFFTPPAVVSSSPAALSVESWQLAETARGRGGWLPTTAIADNMPRSVLTGNITITSGTLRMAYGLVLPKGRTVTAINVLSGSTALVTGSNQWFALYDKSRNQLAITTDDTSTAWANNVVKRLLLSSPYVPGSDIEAYVGVLVVAATPPTLAGPATSGAAHIVTPFMGGNSSSGLTNPASAPATAAAITSAAPFYCWVD